MTAAGATAHIVHDGGYGRVGSTNKEGAPA